MGRSVVESKLVVSFSIAMSKAVSDLDSEVAGKGKFFSRPGGIPEDKARIMIGQLAIALGFLHSKGIIHRNFKAGNILLDAKRRPMVADFGCAVEASNMLLDLSEAGACDYRVRAPEVIVFPVGVQAPPYGLESDWWSLGVLTYNILTGNVQRPEGGNNGPFLDSLNDMIPFSMVFINAYARKQTLRPEQYIDRAKIARLSPDARSFVLALLEVDPARRLGSYSGDGKKGWEAVMPPLARVSGPQQAHGRRRQAGAGARLPPRFRHPHGPPAKPPGAARAADECAPRTASKGAGGPGNGLGRGCEGVREPDGGQEDPGPGRAMRSVLPPVRRAPSRGEGRQG
ncbi:kinase-like domain-containing protein [Hyaloraphidium curvatum]|nr:kinase-like domain-containing protein [Hyaloraphidium curvatum]